MRAALAIGFHSGMRRGEVVGLRWEHVRDGRGARTGAPRHEIMKITGHKSEAVKRYAIENRERRREALKEVAAYRAARNGEISGKVAEPEQAEPTATPTVH